MAASWSWEPNQETLEHRDLNAEYFGAPESDPERDYWDHEAETVFQEPLRFVTATDTGHLCPRCHGPVTWTDHLPPVEYGMPVRCFAVTR